jgi:peptidoglycan/xylan/chitin deacetylase (PgdA/CDA1 family)
MNRWRGVALGLCVVALAVLGSPVGADRVDRMVAVTFDDLPATASVSGSLDHLVRQTQDLLASARKHRIPAVGFVNEGKLFAGKGEADVEARSRLLGMWLDAGLELGNHTYSHGDLNHLPLEAFEADVVRGEVVTRRLMAAHGRPLRYFRHPFLHVGEELTKRRALEAFLSQRGYVVAPVTIDNDEYVFAAAYAAAARRHDEAAAVRIADGYLRYMAEVFSYFEDVSQRVVGRPIAHVLLLHANHLNADHFGRVADMLAARGYRFVTLEKALEDPVYQRPDEFVGNPGNSWLNHWEVTAGRPPVPTPPAPDWVTAYTRQ